MTEARWGFVCAECGCYVDEALRPTRGEQHKPGCKLDPGERWATLDHEDVAELLEKNTPKGGNLKREKQRTTVPPQKTYVVDDDPGPVPDIDTVPDLPLPESVKRRLTNGT